MREVEGRNQMENRRGKDGDERPMDGGNEMKNRRGGGRKMMESGRL